MNICINTQESHVKHLRHRGVPANWDYLQFRTGLVHECSNSIVHAHVVTGVSRWAIDMLPKCKRISVWSRAERYISDISDVKRVAGDLRRYDTHVTLMYRFEHNSHLHPWQFVCIRPINMSRHTLSHLTVTVPYTILNAIGLRFIVLLLWFHTGLCVLSNFLRSVIFLNFQHCGCTR